MRISLKTREIFLRNREFVLMGDINDRIRILRNEKSYTQKGFADLLGVDQTAVSNWERKRNYPDHETLIKISEIFEVTLDWLLKGVESNFSKPKTSINAIKSNVIPSDLNFYPVVSIVLAGLPIEIYKEENIETSMPFKYPHKEGCFAVKAEGDSMYNPLKNNSISDGDYILADPSVNVQSGDVVIIALTNNRQLVKQIIYPKQTEEKIELRSFNPDYPPIYIDEADIQQLYKVVNLARMQKI